MKKETKTLLITWVAVLTLIACVIGATYAYFTAQMGEGVGADINAATGTTDSLKFTAGKAINIVANQENFGKDKGNLSDATTGQVELMANNTTNDATYNYQVYLKILKNEFTYTSENNTAELLLRVTSPDGTELTNISGLNYVTIGDTSGFDITTAKELIAIAKDKEIHATTEKVTEEWNISIILVNLETNQKENTGKAFNAQLSIQQEPIEVTLADKCVGQNMSQCLKDNVTLEPALLHHDVNLANGAEDDSYRYTGANPNNYVCFGSDAETCPSANLYRIIGVYGDQTKLVHATYATTVEIGTAAHFANNIFSWSGQSDNGTNIWANSTLNTESLNGTFLTNLGPTWADKIATTTWNVGGIGYENLNEDTTVKDTYDYEVGANKRSTTYEAKIGMPYANEYGYAAESNYWTTELLNYMSPLNLNWMGNGENYWTISFCNNCADTSDRVFMVYTAGPVLNTTVSGGGLRVRPTFNLVSSVKISGGLGTESAPFRIEI